MNRAVELEDPATGLATREGFDHLYAFAFSLGGRGLPPTLLVLAPDSPDGPSSEDDLAAFGRALRQATRRTDVVARYTPDEFVCLLVDCNAAGALLAADRLRFDLADVIGERGLTLSAGVATYREGMESGDELIAAARGALRSARDAGGDRTEVAPSGLT